MSVRPSVRNFFFWREETKTANNLCRVSGLVYFLSQQKRGNPSLSIYQYINLSILLYQSFTLNLYFNLPLSTYFFNLCFCTFQSVQDVRRIVVRSRACFVSLSKWSLHVCNFYLSIFHFQSVFQSL